MLTQDSSATSAQVQARYITQKNGQKVVLRDTNCTEKTFSKPTVFVCVIILQIKKASILGVISEKFVLIQQMETNKHE